MKAVWTRREVILLPAMIVGLVVLAPFKQMLRFIELARPKARPELAPEWIEVLKLRYHEALNDRAIAQRMGVSDRAVRSYWKRMCDRLGISCDSHKDMRIKIEIEARKVGLID